MADAIITKECLEIIKKVLDRAIAMGILIESHRYPAMMNVEVAYKFFNMDINKWLKSDDEIFIHDFKGIEENVNPDLAKAVQRKITTAENCGTKLFNGFVPKILTA